MLIVHWISGIIGKPLDHEGVLSCAELLAFGKAGLCRDGVQLLGVRLLSWRSGSRRPGHGEGCRLLMKMGETSSNPVCGRCPSSMIIPCPWYLVFRGCGCQRHDSTGREYRRLGNWEAVSRAQLHVIGQAAQRKPPEPPLSPPLKAARERRRIVRSRVSRRASELSAAWLAAKWKLFGTTQDWSVKLRGPTRDWACLTSGLDVSYDHGEVCFFFPFFFSSHVWPICP